MIANKDKYRFADFTLDNYKNLIELAKRKGFNFISYTDEFISGRKDILWRHDVEFEPDIALKMAEIEFAAGVRTTYFFQLHSQFYNLLDSHYSLVLKKIKELGHYVGLHFDSHYYKVNEEEQLEKYISLDREYLETVLDVRIDTFSFHNTTPFTHGCLKFRYAGLINVYSSHFKAKFNYCGDSLGYWRFECLGDVLSDDSIQHLQVLIHDANWSDEILSPRKRIKQVLYNHAERVYEEQVSGLHQKGLLCPDDEED